MNKQNIQSKFSARDIRNLIETARDNGHDQWSKSLAYEVNMDNEEVVIKTEGGIVIKKLQDVITHPEFMKAVAGKESYLSKRYKNFPWVIFVDELFKKLQKV